MHRFGGEKMDSGTRICPNLTQFGVTAFVATRKLIKAAQQEGATPLSDRKLEVLQWIASGNRIIVAAGTLWGFRTDGWKTIFGISGSVCR